MCKLFEKIVNYRLRWTLGDKKFLASQQSGFRQKRSTLDPLINLQTIISEAFKNKQHLIAVCMDIEKAYEMTWRHRILKTLEDQGINENIFAFIKNYISQRHIQVRVNGELSKKFILENGVPQGSVMSTTLLLIASNAVIQEIKKPVSSSIFADDLTIFCKGKNFQSTILTIQQTLNKLWNWSLTNGYKFSQSKTEYIIFSRNKIPGKIPGLQLDKQDIKEVDQVKLIGLIFDPKLT